MSSPSETLAAKIIEKLIEQKLLSRPEARKILPKLADGKLGPEDWRLSIEINMPQKTQS